MYTVVLAVLLFILPSVTQAATLSFSPANASVSTGATVTETIVVSSTNQALNAVSGTIFFPSDLLQVVSVSKVNSILSLWVQEPAFSNANGTITFAGIVPNPGYTGSRGQVISIQFRGKKVGTAEVTFTSASEVLANDGNGTNILTATPSATVTVTAAQPQTEPTPPSSSQKGDLTARITSSTHPDETQWYKLSHVVFDWTNAQGVTAVRLGYDKNAEGKPEVLYSDPISHKELDLTDGIWYFHVQEKDSGGWGPVSTHKIQIDTVPPLPFTLAFLNGTTTVQFGNTIAIQFTAADELSGIDHYGLAIDGKESTVSAEEGGRPYAISGDTGTHVLLVRAYDKAGNITTAEGTFSVVGDAPSSSPLFGFGWLALNYFSLVLVILSILGTLLFGVWYIRVHFSAYRRRLSRELGLTHTHVHKEFDNLKQAITEELLKLEHAKSARALTREEERLIARFKKLLDQSEQEIERDIENIPR